jgi:glycosyltransferase involved in cell wall biosynthesis
MKIHPGDFMLEEPLISIGVPVYNDAPWLRNALDHLLAQDYTNLEIILADDGSTDGSREICREYAGLDKRLRLFENRHNLGSWGNHKFVFDVSQGDFFAWGSGHDFYTPSFISRMFENLHLNPILVQCCPKSELLVDGKPFKPPGILDTRGLTPIERVKKIMEFRLNGGSIDIFYGLYRSAALGNVVIGRDVVSADEIMLAELSLLGEVLQVDEIMLHKVNTRGAMNVRANLQSYRAHLDRNRISKGTMIKEYLPRMYSFIEYMNMVEKSNISRADKEHLYIEIKRLAAHYASGIMEELEHFIGHFKMGIPALEAYPLVRRIQAAQVISASEFALLLGFEPNGLRELRSICFAVLSQRNAEGDLHIAENAGRAIQGYRYRLSSKMRGWFRQR